MKVISARSRFAKSLGDKPATNHFQSGGNRTRVRMASLASPGVSIRLRRLKQTTSTKTPPAQVTEGVQESWSTRPDSNRRPSRWQRDALPAELLVPGLLTLRNGARSVELSASGTGKPLATLTLRGCF